MGVAYAQDLAPRAYTITPVHSNAVILTYSFLDGGLTVRPYWLSVAKDRSQ
jgi:hypothetical protein